jgi:CYTH domain-containing protein
MRTSRVFLLAPALARLIEKERGGQPVRQGYFPDQSGRSIHVQLEGDTGHLILVLSHSNGSLEERAGISRLQAEALLDLTAGQVESLNASVNIGSHTVVVQRFISPGPLDLVTVAFKQDRSARKFHPPAWFGPEVTEDPTYQARSVALAGWPSAPEVEITDVALHSLLDALEGHFGARQPQAAAPQPVAPSERPEAEAEVEDGHDQDDLDIEDSVIRDLARSLSPRKR